MEQQKSRKGIIIALAALVAVLVIALAVYFVTRPATVAGAKTVTVEVVHKDGTAKEFQLHTDKEYLGDALVEGKVVEDNQGDYGLFILTADGETVNEANQEWWNVLKDGEALTVGASAQPIADGEHYELVFTVGYDF